MILLFREHNSFVHEKVRFECETCKEEFPKQIDLSRHITLLHKEKKTHKCPTCEKGFSALKLMEKHIARFHQKPSLCQLCKRSFRCLTKYENHVKNCEGKQIKPKIPQVCKKWYFVLKIVLTCCDLKFSKCFGSLEQFNRTVRSTQFLKPNTFLTVFVTEFFFIYVVGTGFSDLIY